MRQHSNLAKDTAEKVVKDIRRATRKQYSAEEKIRIVLEGLRGEDSIAELCRREGIAQNLYYRWSRDFLEAGKKRLAGDTARAATSDEVKDLRRLHHDESRGRHRHVEAGSAGFRVGSGYGDASTSSAIGQRVELRLRRPGQMARAAGHATYPWCALSSDDAGENRALASNAQEPHPARDLLSARRSRS